MNLPKISLRPGELSQLGGTRVTLSLVTVGAIAFGAWQYGQKVEADKNERLQQFLRLQETIVLRDELAHIRAQLTEANKRQVEVDGPALADIQTKVTTINQDVQLLMSDREATRRR